MRDVTIVVGTVGQSIMRSEDNGQTWARIGPRRGFAYEAAVRSIAMHPKEHHILFASTERGLYRSDDRGANWQYVDSALNGHYVWTIAFDPVNPDTMFVGTGTPTPAMMYRSQDGGRTWEKRPVEVAAECEAVGTPRFTGIAVDPSEPSHIWAGLEVDGARHSSDGGATWTIVDVTGRRDIHNVAVTAGPPKTVFIIANREIYASTDNGRSWEARGMQECLPWDYPRKENYLRGIAVDPGNPKRILLSFGDFTPGTSGALAETEDFGKSWKLLPLPVKPNSTMWTFGINADDPSIVFAASRYGYLYRSDDGGASWSKLQRELSEIAAVCWLPN
ncbi:MAG TPA: YCF48-related protein [Candidatus Binatia bacterium]